MVDLLWKVSVSGDLWSNLRPLSPVNKLHSPLSVIIKICDAFGLIIFRFHLRKALVSLKTSPLLSFIFSTFKRIYQAEQELTFKAFWDGKSSIIARADHRVATPLSFVQTVEGNMFSMKDSVWFQIWDPDLPAIVEDTASFDANCAGSWVEKHGKPNIANPKTNVSHLGDSFVMTMETESSSSIQKFGLDSPRQMGFADQLPVFWHWISALPSRA